MQSLAREGFRTGTIVLFTMTSRDAVSAITWSMSTALKEGPGWYG